MVARQKKSREEKKERTPPSFLRIKVPLDDTGQPDLSEWDAHDSTKERYRNLVNNPEFKRKIGLSGKTEEGVSSAARDTFRDDTTGAAERTTDSPTVERPGQTREEKKTETTALPFSASELLWVFDVYTYIVAFLFATTLKTSFDVVYPMVKFDDEQKMAMAEPLSIIMQRYVPSEYLEYAPEFRLGMMLVTITGSNFQRAKEAAEKERADKAKPARNVSHIVMPTPAQPAAEASNAST
jgi:hypothetical protein